MPDIFTFHGAIDDTRRRQLVYAGDFIIFKSIPEMKALTAYAMEMAKETFGVANPQLAHDLLPKEDYLKLSYSLPRAFTKDEKAKTLFYQALAAVGVNLTETYCDWFPMRIQPGKKDLNAIHTSGLHAHRDSWYANVACQTNWWGPLAPMAEGHAVIFYPEYWNKKITNNSHEFDLNAFRNARATVRAKGGSDKEVLAAYPHIHVEEPINERSAIQFYLEPGDLLCFSAAHLHASAINISSTARFSTELRTAHLDDVKNNIGAPNIDGASKTDSLCDFFQMQTGEALTEHLGELLVD